VEGRVQDENILEAAGEKPETVKKFSSDKISFYNKLSISRNQYKTVKFQKKNPKTYFYSFILAQKDFIPLKTD
jgi:hypothetical protein